MIPIKAISERYPLRYDSHSANLCSSELSSSTVVDVSFFGTFRLFLRNRLKILVVLVVVMVSDELLVYSLDDELMWFEFFVVFMVIAFLITMHMMIKLIMMITVTGPANIQI